GEEVLGLFSYRSLAVGVAGGTTAILKGMDLRTADAFIHYDSPVSAEEEYVRASRGPHTANYVLVDESGVLPEIA
ncbi:MAG: hypothetical protein ABI782_09250, partial [Anaerolineaceae bacterium]